MAPKDDYVPLSRSVRTIAQGAMTSLYTLEQAGRADLSAPLARVLEALAGLDYAALDAIDEAHGETPPKRTLVPPKDWKAVK